MAIAVITIFSHQSLKAQEGFYVGVKGLPQLSFLLNSDDSDNDALDMKPTFSGAFGVGMGYNFTDNLGVGLDVLYSMEGQRYEFSGVETFQRLDYLKIPLVLTFNTDPSQPAMFLAKVGPQMSILTDAKILDEDGDELVADNMDTYNDFLIGGTLFLGGSFHLTDNLLMDAGIRTDISFMNAEDEDAVGYPTGREITTPLTTSLEIGFRYIF